MLRPVNDPASLSFLIESKVRLAVHCNNVRCLRRSVLEVGPLVEKLGLDYPIPKVARYLKCTACGGRDCSVNPNWNDEDVPGRPKGYSYPPPIL